MSRYQLRRRPQHAAEGYGGAYPSTNPRELKALYATLPYPTVPEPTIPYPTVPEPTIPYPTVPEPTRAQGAPRAAHLSTRLL